MGARRWAEPTTGLGRPQAIEAKVRALRSEGKGMIAISRLVGCGVGTVQRIVSV